MNGQTESNGTVAYDQGHPFYVTSCRSGPFTNGWHQTCVVNETDLRDCDREKPNYMCAVSPRSLWPTPRSPSHLTNSRMANPLSPPQRLHTINLTFRKGMQFGPRLFPSIPVSIDDLVPLREVVVAAIDHESFAFHSLVARPNITSCGCVTLLRCPCTTGPSLVFRTPATPSS